MRRTSTRRKLAIATWSAPREGNIYARMEVNATEANRYIQHLREESGERVTITHLVGKAAGLALAKAPMLNGRIVLGRYVPYKDVDVAFLVSLEGGGNLAKAKVKNVHELSVSGIAAKLRERVERLRTGGDEEFEKSKPLLKILPSWLIRPILNFTSFLTGGLGVSLPSLGLSAFPFGACIVTSIGMFGMDEAMVPPTPFARVPVYVLVGSIRDRAVVEKGDIVVRPVLTLTFTIDHRFIDGHHASVLGKMLRDILQNPWQLDQAAAESEA